MTSLKTLECLLVAGSCALAWWRPRFAEAGWNRVEVWVGRMPRRAALAAVLLAPLLVRAALLPALGIPKPTIMDEFSYLLGGETFALGRIANPPPPVPEAFQVLYVLTSPAYVSIYPPAQAAVLALGKAVFGHAWWGVFLSIGVMAATAFWMARAFVPDRWALAGGLLAGLHFGVFTYWMNSYWGGSVAAIGGNLVVGAYGRLRKRPRLWPACVFTAGAALLGVRRPYEGLALVLTAGGLLAFELLARRKPRREELARVLVPIAAGMLVFGAANAWYNARTTGDWRNSPYRKGAEQSSQVPIFVSQSLRPAPGLPDNLRRVEAEYRLPAYRKARSPRGYLQWKGEQLLSSAAFYLRPALLLPGLFALATVWALRIWRLAVASFVALAAVAVEIPTHPHYLSPFVPLYCLLLVAGFRALRRWRPRARAFGLALSRWLAASFAVTVAFGAAGAWWTGAEGARRLGVQCCGEHPRDQIERYLNARGGKSLVLIRYGPHHPIHYEYAYNSADLHAAKIVWARDLGDGVTRRLLAAFPGREIWHLDVGMRPDGGPSLRRPGASAISDSCLRGRTRTMEVPWRN